MSPDSGHIQLTASPEISANSKSVIDKMEAVPPAIISTSLVKVIQAFLGKTFSYSVRFN